LRLREGLAEGAAGLPGKPPNFGMFLRSLRDGLPPCRGTAGAETSPCGSCGLAPIGKRSPPATFASAGGEKVPGDDAEGRPPGGVPWRDKWKALILACISCGRPPEATVLVGMDARPAGLRALFNTPIGFDEEDMDDCPGGSEMERTECILSEIGAGETGFEESGEAWEGSARVDESVGEAMLCLGGYTVLMGGEGRHKESFDRARV
jgi:hypothetical protein